MSRGCLLKLAALLMCARAFKDSESNPGITDDKNTATEVIGELDYPLKISCIALEKPPPIVFWSHKTRSSGFLNKDSEYGKTGNTLLIRSLATETLGQYTCQVYSSEGLEAPRVFNVRAYRPDGDISGGEWLVPRDAVSPIPETTSIATWTTTEDLGKTDKPELELAASEGDKITLHCLLDSTLLAGDPLPKVTWKFRGVTIDGTAGRYRVTSDGALQIVSLHRSDTGVYTCEPDDALGEASHDIHLLVNGSSITSKFTEVTKEAAASFDKSGDNTNNATSTTITPTTSTTAVIDLSTLDGDTTTETRESSETSEGSTTDEGSTTAEGTTEFLGTTTLDRCSGFQFGCCADNETEASGPDGQGCPCNTTGFGCSPDGVNPDPVSIPPGIAGEDNATVTGELDQPLHVRCLVYGYPNPSVLWSRDDEVGIVLYNNSIYEVTANVLVIRSLSPDTLGPYTCRAFNEEGRTASWRVVVQAYRPDGLLSGGLWLVPRDTKAPKPTTQASITTNKWLFTGSSITSKFTEVTKEAAASFDKSGDNTNNATSTTITPTTSTTAVIDLSTLDGDTTTEISASSETSEGSSTDEGSTTAEGTTDFLGTTTLDPCSGFQFGCCADNETEASGPDGQGCPCNTTEFGCSRDSVNPGNGLYQPASYLIPGGEGEGPWGEWGEVSPCSRTCGGGVASQKRTCLQSGPEGQPLCTGGDTKYFSCQTQDCPEGSADFRAEQCAAFNDEAFRGYKYNWMPYTKAPNPCELNCMPHGERFYFRHKLQVIDGTRCNDESFDVCVNGVCQPAGCDMMLNSNARKDKCRECRGNGANCRTTAGIFDSQDLMKGYNDILLIPAGSTSIFIEELEPSNNYLALRAKNGTYYLNGHYHIDFPETIMIAGAPWTYERSQQGFAAPDKLRCLGPTAEPLYLSLLLQDENVGIRYEYSVPNNIALPTDNRQ